MPVARFQMPDGRIGRFEVPDGTTPEQAQAIISAQLEQPKPTEPESPYSAKNLAGAAVEPNLSMLSGMVAAPVSGLAGIVGTLIPGHEGQGAEWAEQVGQALTYSPRTEGGRTATEAISYPFRKLAEGGEWAGGNVAEMTGSPLAGTVVGTAINALPLALSKKTSGEPKNTIPGKVAARTMQSAVKPTLADLKSGDAKRAVQTMLEEGINPTSGGMEKAAKITSRLNDQVKAAVESSPETVNISNAGSRLREPYAKARSQVNPTADMNAIRNVWDEFRAHPDIAGKMEIPVQLAQQLKTGTYRSLGNKSYGEIGSSATEAQKALARGLRETIAEKVPEVVAPLKRESGLMNVRSVAERRALMEANKNPMGLALLAENPYAWAGFMADKSALFKALTARILYSTANPDMSRIRRAGAAVNMENQIEQNNE